MPLLKDKYPEAYPWQRTAFCRLLRVTIFETSASFGGDCVLFHVQPLFNNAEAHRWIV
jgi:hypothetical protein